MLGSLVKVDLREEEEDEEGAEDDQTEDEPAGPAIPCASAISVVVVAAAGRHAVSCVRESATRRYFLSKEKG